MLTDRIPQRLYGSVTCAISILVCSILLFVGDFGDWLVIHMAILAPIMAALSYGDSFNAVLLKCVQNLAGVLIGGFLTMLWLVILRSCSLMIAMTPSYNQFVGVAVSAPWLLAFHLLTPRSAVSLSSLTLIFLTLVIYCGDNDYPDASPLKAILSGSVGSIVPVGVALLVHAVTHSGHTTGSSTAPFESGLWRFWDALVDEIIAPGNGIQLDRLRDECMMGMTHNTERSPQQGRRENQSLRCIESLTAIHALVKGRPCSLSGAFCRHLMELKSSRRSEGAVDSLVLMSSELSSSNDPTRTASVRMTTLARLVSKLFGRIRRLESTIAVQNSQSWFNLVSFGAFRKPTCSWPSKSALIDAFRFTAVLIGLAELLVYWDARDSTVDTYALWAMVPALLLAERVEYLGQAVREGAWFTLAAFLGSGLGIVSLLLNDTRRSSYVAEFVIALIFGFTLQVKVPTTRAGIIFVVSWMICVLGNLGLDSPTSSPSTGSLNLLWRIALYRTAITCFSVFVMALSFMIIPAKSASQVAGDRLRAVAADSLRRVVSVLAMEGSGKHADGLDRELTGSPQISGVSDKTPPRTSELIHFATAEYPSLVAFSHGECTSSRYPLIDSKLLMDWAAAVSALVGVMALGPLTDIGTFPQITSLRDASTGLQSELETLTIPGRLLAGQPSEVKPRARQLNEALSMARRWLLTADDPSAGQAHGTVVVATVLTEVVKAWLPIESHLGLLEPCEDVDV